MADSTPSPRLRMSALEKARRRLSAAAQTQQPEQIQATPEPVTPTSASSTTAAAQLTASPSPTRSPRDRLSHPPSSYTYQHPDSTPSPPPPPVPPRQHLPPSPGDPAPGPAPAPLSVITSASTAPPTHPLPPIPPPSPSPLPGPLADPTASVPSNFSAADTENKASTDKLPLIVKHRPTAILSPTPQPFVATPPSSATGQLLPSPRAAGDRSLPPTPHTPQTPQTASSNPSRPGSAALGPSSGEQSDSSMGRKGAGNGRLSPASAEHVQHFRDVVKEPLRCRSRASSLDVKKPTEQRPEREPHLAEVQKLSTFTKEPYFFLIVPVLVGLTIVTFGWRMFFTVLTLVAAPLIARYVIPMKPKQQHSGADDAWPPKSTQSESVAWVNHALRALFPLVSTDVLTPFIDLLEDALIQQVPPIVTSVRLTSVSLGIEPVLLTSMKPLTDDQWFQALAEAGAVNGTAPVPPPKTSNESSQNGTEPKSRPVSVSSASPSVGHGSSAPVPPTTHRSVPSPIITPTNANTSTRTRTGRSASSVSRTSAASDTEHAPASAGAMNSTQQQLRKRDRILRRLKRHRREPDQEPLSTASATFPRDGADHDEDLESDQYVNYEVGFTYRRSADMRMRGSGLHAIAHFGWGVKGVGGSEIPVYLDVSELKGKMRVRILLSASPPFVREVTFSFVAMPEFDIAARPLRSGSFNAMDIPLIKSYVEKSVARVAAGFIAPKSYTMNVERLLMGHANALTTNTIGVFHIVIHNAHGLPRTDTMGSCDPYVAISYAKFNKPLFSTRTIVDTTEPVWEEEAFILVPADAITLGEKLRLRVCDSDRFSADDLVGVVEVDVLEMVEQAAAHPGDIPFERQDVLQAISPGMKVQGEIEWSLRFHPLWQMPTKELQQRVEALKETRGEGSTPAPWWFEWLDKYVEVPEWEKERSKRRRDHVDLFTGERMRYEVEATGKPQIELPSGVLQFHIHQCADLEIESLQGTFSGSASRRKSAAMGKPALQDVIDRGPADNTDPPSAYCEVHVNDKYVYRTRTKQLTPVPYFNAVSERFIRDWRLAKITFVVKDARDREHDPILGVVSMKLKDVLKDHSQVTHWYPLVGGIGWGRLRISLLFKPFHMHVLESISTFETSTFDMTSLTTTTDMFELAGGKIPILVMESEYDRAFLTCSSERKSIESGKVEEPDPQYDDELQAEPEIGEFGNGMQIPNDYDPKVEGQQSLGVSPESLRAPSLSPSQRKRSESIMRLKGSFARRRETISSSLSRHKNATTDTAASAASIHATNVAGLDVEWRSRHPTTRLAVQYRHSCCLVFTFVTKRVIKKRKIHAIATLRLSDCPDGEVLTRTIPLFATASVRDAMKAARKFTEATKFSGATGSRLSRELGNEIPLVGYATVQFVLHPGISRAHAKLAKRDMKFRSVYRAWEATRLQYANENADDLSGSDDDDDDDDDGDDFDDDNNNRNNKNQDDKFDSDMDMESDLDDAMDSAAARATQRLHRDDTRIMRAEQSHGKALRERNRGIFQLKLARTGKFVKDKVEAKLLAASVGGVGRRAHGMDLEPEIEGQSKL